MTNISDFVKEIVDGDYLTGDHMNLFHEIVSHQTEFRPQNVFFVGALNFIQSVPQGQPHVQILSGNVTALGQITHWICTYYNGESVHIYDSLNTQSLNNAEMQQFLASLYPYHPPYIFETVMQQPNAIDCGVFAIAFATSLLNNRNPSTEMYDHSRMRLHLLKIYNEMRLAPFPTVASSLLELELPLADANSESAAQCVIRGQPVEINLKTLTEKRVELEEQIIGKRCLPMPTKNYGKKKRKSIKTHYVIEEKEIEKNSVNPTTVPRVNPITLLRVPKSEDKQETKGLPVQVHSRPIIEKGVQFEKRKDMNRKNFIEIKKESMKTYYVIQKKEVGKNLVDSTTAPKVDPIILLRVSKSEYKKIQRCERRNEQKRKKRELETINEKSQRLQDRKNKDLQAIENNNKRTHKVGINGPLENIDEHYCGKMNIICSFCSSKNFAAEMPSDKIFTTCCQKGKIDLSHLSNRPYPKFLQDLMTNKHMHSRNFIDNIRSFNSAFSLASMGVQMKSPPGFGPYCFRIHGQICHKSVTLHPLPGEQRKYAQLYILDPEEATRQRLNISENIACNESVMAMIGKFMSDNNQLVKAYKMLYEVELETAAEARSKGIPMPEIGLAIKFDRVADKRRYNAPHCNEVAIVFQNTDGEPPFERDLLIYLRPDSSENNNFTTKTKRISVLHPSLEPMTYPLFFPYGESGWHSNILMKGLSKRVTQMAYYGCRLAMRNEFNPFLNAGKLTQQYIVDAYVKMESNRLRWIREHQKDLHAENYQGLMDYLHSEAAEKGLEVGKPIILPSSFIGSPRNMHQNYLDAMAIIRKFGKPDLFITVTCNPKWREIVENLEPHQKVEHRPDLVARVFDLKLKEILHDICKKHVLGRVVAKVHVIEFQKRGLPHAHILIIFNDEDKLRNSNDIDKCVSAEIPDPIASPQLHNIVMKHMVHGPCGVHNPHSPCMNDGSCTKGFPKPFEAETVHNLDGYPRYQRRNTNKTFQKNNVEVDNRWIVPYNRYLSLKYNCHINVEVCASVKSVKYLFKYVYKGYDCANIEITETVTNGKLIRDEVKMFLDSRYISAPEGAWRLFAKSMHHQSHTIIRLAVHLPDQQIILFNQKQDSEALMQSLSLKTSTLMAWFKLNQENDDAKNYYYSEIPEHYVFDKKNGWKQRKKGAAQVIGRMYSVNISEGERYFLRLLLLHVRGATSFENLRTINNVTYKSFKEAAQKLGLLDDDSIWRDSLLDAVIEKMPTVLRELFATICIFGCPLEPQKLWEEFLEYFIEDISKKHKNHKSACEDCENVALSDVQNILRLHGKQCSDFQLKTPPKNLPNCIDEVFNMKEEEAIGKDLLQTLNHEQKVVYNIVMDAVGTSLCSNNCFYLDGPGGSGKTYLYKTLLSNLRGQGYTAVVVASTGIAANLLKGGRTYHSHFKMPIPIVENSTSNLKMNSQDAKILREAKIIIWDEATMASSHALNAVDRLLRSVMKIDKPFGGKVILLGGDFRQCLPVVPHAHRAAVVQTSIKYSHLWAHFQVLKLKTNVRSVDSSYTAWLTQVGNGNTRKWKDLEDDVIKIRNDIISNESIVAEIFGTSLKASDMIRYSNTAILSPQNEDTAKINEEVLSILEGNTTTYYSIDSIECEDIAEKNNYPIEFLNSLTPSGMPPHKLNLKEGAIIMLLRNLNTRKGLCNGTRLLVTKLAKNLITATVLTGSAYGKSVFIPQIDLAPSNPDIPFVLRRRQFPVKLAFSITINKAQGQTFDKVGVYLPKPVFTHGQLYVALSRVRRACDIKVKIVDGTQQGSLLKNSNKIFTKNIVYKEIL